MPEKGPELILNPIFNEHEKIGWRLELNCEYCPVGRIRGEGAKGKCLNCVFHKISPHLKKSIKHVKFRDSTCRVLELGIRLFRNWQEIVKRLGKELIREKMDGGIPNSIKNPIEFFENPNSFIPYRIFKRVEDHIKSKEIYAKYKSLKERGHLELFKLFDIHITETNHGRLPAHILAKEKITSYFVGDSKEYQVQVLSTVMGSEKLYQIENIFERNWNEEFQEITACIGSDVGKEIPLHLPFFSRIRIIKNRLLNKIDVFFPDLDEEKKEQIAAVFTFKFLHLECFFPPLFDPNIEEIFFDGNKGEIYLNHSKFGRCRTNLYLNLGNIESFKTFVRIESRKRFDHENSSIKFDIQHPNFLLRISTDCPPLIEGEIAFDIRKLYKNRLNLIDLLHLNTMSIEIAGFLVFCVFKKCNVTVCGETDSGKTTLINALDMITPLNWRTVYIEEVAESMDSMDGAHQLKFNPPNSKKSEIIENLLHRSPDIIYLGELLNQDDVGAFFHCCSTGLKGFQTIHAQTIESLIRRWQYHFGIDPSCFSDLDVIVLMKKTPDGRKVVRISEIRVNEENRAEIIDFFRYNPKCRMWIPGELYNTKLLYNLNRVEDLPPEILDLELTRIKAEITNHSSIVTLRKSLMSHQ